VIQFGEGISSVCTVAYEETERGWKVEDAQASRDLLVLTETNSAGASRAIFRHGGDSDYRALPTNMVNVEMAADTVLFWTWDAGHVLVGSTRDRIRTLRPILLFARLPSNQSCVGIESAAGRFVLFRNECAGPGGGFASGAVERVLFDTSAGGTVARLDGIGGPVGVTPDGKIVAAGPEGICTVPAKADWGARPTSLSGSAWGR
jgi:hypothetical protein